MSEKSKMNRAKRQEMEKKKGDSIVKWIFIVLVALAVIFMIWSVAVNS
jgi:uncharacterized Rmd1/YagE family protein